MSALSRPAGDLPDILSDLLEQASLLPDLPDPDVILSNAHRRLDHYQAIAEAAEAEMNRSRLVIAAFNGDGPNPLIQPRRPSADRGVSNDVLVAVVTALGNRDYAGIHTLAADSSVSRGHVGRAMGIATERGYAARTNPAAARKFRWKITDSGMEFVTASKK